MNKIMIAVSDSTHYKFYETLRKKAPNESFFIVMTYNFIDAKEKLFEYLPDYVLMDYFLENGTAIQILGLIAQSHLDTKAIILHDNLDYEFVRCAFIHGATDYVPIKDFHIDDFLKKVSEKTDFQMENARLQLQRYLGLVKDQQAINKMNLFQLLDLNQVTFDSTNYLVYFRIDCIHAVYANLTQERHRLQVQLQAMIQESLKCSLQILFSKNHSGVILLHSSNIIEIEESLNQMIQSVRRQLEFSISFILRMMDFSEMLDEEAKKELFLNAYIELTQHQDDKFYLYKSMIIKEYLVFESLNILNPFYQRKRFAMIKDINRDNLFSFLETTLNYFMNHRVKPEDVRKFYIYNLTKIQIIIQEQCITPSFSGDQFILLIQFCEFHDDLRKILENYFTLLLKNIDEQRIGYSKHVQAIIKLIEHDPKSKFTLEDFSNKVQLSSVHISRTFKKETGVSLFDFINEVKMKEACVLLVTTKKLIKDISFELGFQNQFYFNKVFHKYFHMNPSEYRKTTKSKNDE